MTGILLVIACLVALSGFFSAAEIAIFSLSGPRARALLAEGRSGAPALVDLKSNPERLLAILLAGNTLTGVIAASLATALGMERFGSPGVACAIGAVTLLLLVFGQVAPKGLASAHAEGIALRAAPLLRLLSWLLFPLVRPMEALTRWLVGRGERSGRGTLSPGEIRELNAIAHLEGTINEHESRIIERVFRMDETRAWDIMTPRVEVFAWAASRTLAEIAADLHSVRYSRVPVYGESIDDIVGVLYTRDAYTSLISGMRDVPLRDLAREPFFVPGSIPLTRLLSDFQARRIHMGIVIDEYGGTDGLVTLEDLLEELVGEIVDETDVEQPAITRISRNEVLVQGSADLREVNHFFNTTLPQLEHRSMNGYLLAEFGHVPRAGEVLERDGIRIRVAESTEQLVVKALLTRPHAADEDAAAAPPRTSAAG